MKKISLFSFLSFFMITGILSAQPGDTISAKRITEKGAKGDIILGNEYKQKQLNAASPQVLGNAVSVLKKEPAPATKNKKYRHK